MGFLCIDKENKKDVSQKELIEQKFLRDNALNNVYNLTPEINFCQEIFFNPEYYAIGAIKLNTGLTTTITGCTTGTTGIYNLDYTGDVNLEFVITGNTNYTNYEGNFCLKYFTKNNFNPTIATGGLINGTEFTEDCFSFSGLTASSVVKIFSEGSLPKTWQEYLIRPYYTFVSKECNPGVIFNSWYGTPQLNNFQEDTDYYFMTVTNPPTPILAGPSGAVGYANQTLITDKLYVNGITTTLGPQAINGERNYFFLSAVPLDNQILLILNGIQLTQGYDFELISNGIGTPTIVDVKREIKDTDWLLATYIVGTPQSWVTNLGIYDINTILLDGFTTTTTPSYRTVGDNTINYNPVTNNYEFFTQFPIDKTFASIITVNGVKLAIDEQYFISTSFPGRIIFDKNSTIFNVGDIISVLYVTESNNQNNNNYGSLKTNQFTAQWSVPTSFTNETVTGRFIVQAYDNDTNNLTNQVIIDYTPGESNYEALLTSLPLNINFKFVVTFEATYIGYLNNKVITCSSAEGFFDTTNRYINNTY